MSSFRGKLPKAPNTEKCIRRSTIAEKLERPNVAGVLLV